MNRIFVSSAFQDNQPIRDLITEDLKKEIGRRLRRHYGEMGLHITDTRWGIYTDSETAKEKSLVFCLNLLNKAGPPMPMIISMADRYGWRPGCDEDGQRMLSRAKEVVELPAFKAHTFRDESITEMEIMCGALADKACLDRAVFIFIDYINKEYDEQQRQELLAEEALKKRVLEKIPKSRQEKIVIKVTLDASPNAASEREQLREKVLDQLVERVWKILRTYYENRLEYDVSDPERKTHLSNMRNRAEFLKGRQKELAFIESTIHRNPVTFIQGESGIGKSTLLSRAVYDLSHEGEGRPIYEIFPLYCGLTEKSDTPMDILISINNYFRSVLSLNEAVPLTFAEGIDYLYRSYQLYNAKTSTPPLLIALDALDQLRDEVRGLAFKLINPAANNKIHVLASFTHDVEVPHRFTNVPTLTLRSADVTEREALLLGVLEEYNKWELPATISRALTTHTSFENALAVNMFIQHMHIHFSEEEFKAIYQTERTSNKRADALIQERQETLLQEFTQQQTLEQKAAYMLLSACQKKHFPEEILFYMAFSRHGLDERTLLQLAKQNHFAVKENDCADFFDSFMDVFTLRNDGCYDFAHKCYRNGLCDEYLRRFGDEKRLEALFEELLRMQYEGEKPDLKNLQDTGLFAKPTVLVLQALFERGLLRKISDEACTLFHKKNLPRLLAHANIFVAMYDIYSSGEKLSGCIITEMPHHMIGAKLYDCLRTLIVTCANNHTDANQQMLQSIAKSIYQSGCINKMFDSRATSDDNPIVGFSYQYLLPLFGTADDDVYQRFLLMNQLPRSSRNDSNETDFCENLKRHTERLVWRYTSVFDTLNEGVYSHDSPMVVADINFVTAELNHLYAVCNQTIREKCAVYGLPPYPIEDLGECLRGENGKKWRTALADVETQTQLYCTATLLLHNIRLADLVHSFDYADSQLPTLYRYKKDDGARKEDDFNKIEKTLTALNMTLPLMKHECLTHIAYNPEQIETALKVFEREIQSNQDDKSGSGSVKAVWFLSNLLEQWSQNIIGKHWTDQPRIPAIQYAIWIDNAYMGFLERWQGDLFSENYRRDKPPILNRNRILPWCETHLEIAKRYAVDSGSRNAFEKLASLFKSFIIAYSLDMNEDSFKKIQQLQTEMMDYYMAVFYRYNQQSDRAGSFGAESEKHKVSETAYRIYKALFSCEAIDEQYRMADIRPNTASKIAWLANAESYLIPILNAKLSTRHLDGCEIRVLCDNLETQALLHEQDGDATAAAACRLRLLRHIDSVIMDSVAFSKTSVIFMRKTKAVLEEYRENPAYATLKPYLSNFLKDIEEYAEQRNATIKDNLIGWSKLVGWERKHKVVIK